MLGRAEVEVDGDFKLRFADDGPQDFRVGFALESALAGRFRFVEDVDQFLPDTRAGIAHGMNDASPVWVLAIP